MIPGLQLQLCDSASDVHRWDKTRWTGRRLPSALAPGPGLLLATATTQRVFVLGRIRATGSRHCFERACS